MASPTGTEREDWRYRIPFEPVVVAGVLYAARCRQT
jgi:hypothetical protein